MVSQPTAAPTNSPFALEITVALDEFALLPSWRNSLKIKQFATRNDSLSDNGGESQVGLWKRRGDKRDEVDYRNFTFRVTW